jgi:hypothetical protein
MVGRLLLLVWLLWLGPGPKKSYDFGKHKSGYLTFPLPRKQKIVSKPVGDTLKVKP